MRSFLVLLAVGLFLAAVMPAHSDTIYSSVAGLNSGGITFSNGGQVSYAEDDYVTTFAGTAPAFLLGQAKFAGGVAAADTSLHFGFFDSAGNSFGGFDIAFPAGGNYVWTVTPQVAAIIPTSGRLRISAVGNAVGTWQYRSGSPEIGSNNSSFGSAPQGSAMMFEFTGTPVPEPGSLIALSAGLLGLVGSALRKRLF